MYVLRMYWVLQQYIPDLSASLRGGMAALCHVKVKVIERIAFDVAKYAVIASVTQSTIIIEKIETEQKAVYTSTCKHNLPA